MNRPHRWPAVVAAAAALAVEWVWAQAPARAAAPSVERAQYLWSRSPHGRMLQRILPRAVEPQDLPDPESAGARLTARYCVQCHYLPSPHMHSAARWKASVERMVWRMRGHGNMGALMKGMMDDMAAPTDAEVAVLTAYLQAHAQAEMDPAHPALKSTDGERYRIACTQCHELPDPRRHTAGEWPVVVARMKRHMVATNTVVGAPDLRTDPVLETTAIVRFLQRHAAPGPGR